MNTHTFEKLLQYTDIPISLPYSTMQSRYVQQSVSALDQYNKHPQLPLTHTNTHTYEMRRGAISTVLMINEQMWDEPLVLNDTNP